MAVRRVRGASGSPARAAVSSVRSAATVDVSGLCRLPGLAGGSLCGAIRRAARGRREGVGARPVGSEGVGGGPPARCVGRCRRARATAAPRDLHRSGSQAPAESSPRFSSGGRDRKASVPRPRVACRAATASARTAGSQRACQPCRTRACGAGCFSIARRCRRPSVADRRRHLRDRRSDRRVRARALLQRRAAYLGRDRDTIACHLTCGGVIRPRR